MTLLEKLDNLIELQHMNKRQLSLKTEIPYSTIDNIWKRNTDSMRLPTFKTLCDFFNVTMESMAYDDQEIRYRDDVPADTLTRDERELIKLYSELDDRGKDTVRSTARTQHELAADDHKPEDTGDTVSSSEDIRERGA